MKHFNILMKFFHLSLFLFSTHILFAQNDNKNFLKSAQTLAYESPDKSLSLITYAFDNQKDLKTKADILLNMAEIFALKGEFHLSVQKIHEVKKVIWENYNEDLNFRAEILLCNLMIEQGLPDLAKTRIQQLQLEVNKISDSSILFSYYVTQLKLEEKDEKKISQLKKHSFSNLRNNDKLSNNQLNLIIGNKYLNKKIFDSAGYYFDEIIERNKSLAIKDYFYYSAINGKAKNLINKGLYAKSSELLEKSIQEIDNGFKLTLLKNYNETLALGYKKADNFQSFAHYNQSFIEDLKTANENKQLFRIFLLNLLEEEDNYYLERKQSNYQTISWGLGGFFLVMLISLGSSYSLSYKKNQKLLKIKEEENKTSSQTIFIIPDKTEQKILVKLSKFEASQKFVNPNLSLTSLAKEINTNTAYLSEIINKHKDKNFKTYLNELRINFIIDKLQNNPEYLQYKTSHLAEECGFNSRNSFTLVFKSITGISPSVYIDAIRNKKEL